MMTTNTEDGWSYVFNCHYNIAYADSNMTLKENTDNLAEFDIDYADCYTSIDRVKKKEEDGSMLYEHSTSIVYWLSLYRVPEAMIINLFMPVVILIAL
jgi:hypothetical protein